MPVAAFNTLASWVVNALVESLEGAGECRISILQPGGGVQGEISGTCAYPLLGSLR